MTFNNNLLMTVALNPTRLEPKLLSSPRRVVLSSLDRAEGEVSAELLINISQHDITFQRRLTFIDAL